MHQMNDASMCGECHQRGRTPLPPVLDAGEKGGRASVADSVTVPLVMTSTYFFRDTAHLIDFEVCRRPQIQLPTASFVSRMLITLS